MYIWTWAWFWWTWVDPGGLRGQLRYSVLKIRFKCKEEVLNLGLYAHNKICTTCDLQFYQSLTFKLVFLRYWPIYIYIISYIMHNTRLTVHLFLWPGPEPVVSIHIWILWITISSEVHWHLPFIILHPCPINLISTLWCSS